MRHQPQPAQAARSPSPWTLNVRGLLRDREFIKVTTFVLPPRAKVEVLQLMEQLRRGRAIGPLGPLPEMTTSEMVREIAWRVETLPPEDARTVAAYLRRLTRRRAPRRTR